MPGPSTSSDLLAASAAVSAAPAVLMGVIALGGSAATVVTVYDNASAASGKILAQAFVPVATTTHIPLDVGVVAVNGLYCSISGTGGKAVIHFERA